jgi:hypothetical protein
MPVVSVSLSEVGYEGYKELPKGKRSDRPFTIACFMAGHTGTHHLNMEEDE